jgi:hypothetical protein
VSLAGIIGWIGMIPRLAPIPWETLRGAGETRV